MSGRTDIAKGRVKEAAGVLVGNKKLERRGKVDQAVGTVRRTSEKAVDKVESSRCASKAGWWHGGLG